MKPEKRNTGLRLTSFCLIIISFLPALCLSSFSQDISVNDTIIRSKHEIITQPLDNIHKSIPVLETDLNNTILRLQLNGKGNNRNSLDSLRTKASKYRFTRKLYDFVVVNKPSSRLGLENRGEAVFPSYSGKIIRNITISRLHVFGSNLDDPDHFLPNRTEKLLNRTHVNSNENIIRKYLLFHEGDTLSPVLLSDNERLLRNLNYIDDARIIINPANNDSVDIRVITKDIYSIGARAELKGLSKGMVSVYDENIFGTGQEFGIEIPWNSVYPDSPGFGANYRINNIMSTFSNLDFYFNNGLGRQTYGFNLSRDLVSYSTKYAGGIAIRRMSIYKDLELPIEPVPVKYTLQDYWLQRSFLLQKESVSRIVLGARYTNNNVFNHPLILPETYYNLQKYKLLLGSISYSDRKYQKANLIYSYGRAEDIPFGGLINLIIGIENNEFKKRTYLGGSLAGGGTLGRLGYLQSSADIGAFLRSKKTEQGVFSLKTRFISGLYHLGNHMIRNFISVDYTRGFDRYKDEKLYFQRKNGFSGFRNDSIGNAQRLVLGIESVLFSPLDFYGFRLAAYFFADAGALYGLNEGIASSTFLTSVGVGLRIRNDNLILNTFQIRFGFYPNPPGYSVIEPLIFSGEQLLEPENFEPRSPALIPYK